MTGAMITGRDGVMDDGRSTNETDFLLHCRQAKSAPKRAMAWPESACARLVDQISAMRLVVWGVLVAGPFPVPSGMGSDKMGNADTSTAHDDDDDQRCARALAFRFSVLWVKLLQ